MTDEEKQDQIEIVCEPHFGPHKMTIGDLKKQIHNKAIQEAIEAVSYLNGLTARDSYKLAISELEKLKK